MRTQHFGQRRWPAAALALTLGALPVLLATETAVAAEQDICYISVHDHSPEVFPGGLHVHNTCIE